MTKQLSLGSLVWTEIADANGFRKVRPAVVVTPTALIDATAPIHVIAVTSHLPAPLPDDHVLLPWHPQGHPRTKLNRRSAAICSWRRTISMNDVRIVGGVVPSPIMNIILAKIQGSISPPQPQVPPSSPPMPP